MSTSTDQDFVVRVSTNAPSWPWLRQTPGGHGRWGRCRFVVDEDIEECDFWVVFSGVTGLQRCRCDPANTLFIAGEPPSVRQYDQRFLAQFAAVWTCDRETRHPNRVLTQPALPWHIGVRNLDGSIAPGAAGIESFIEDWPVAKSRTLSVISSDKAFTAPHAQRLAFVRRLKDHFGDRLDVFGRGIRDIPDKAAAIAPYRYHIVLENSAFADYWTEKLPDAVLGGAFPIYWGCPNIADYFPQESLQPIDIDDESGAIEKIEAILRDDPYDQRFDQLAEARRRVLYEFNLFALLDRWVSGQKVGAKRLCTVAPDKWFRGRKVRRKLASLAIRDGFNRIAKRLRRGD